jgi:hypothetical protein
VTQQKNPQDPGAGDILAKAKIYQEDEQPWRWTIRGTQEASISVIPWFKNKGRKNRQEGNPPFDGNVFYI